MFKLALRNIFRHKLRTGITSAAIILGVAGTILTGGFVEDIFLQLGEFTIRAQSGHLQIAKEGFFAHGSRTPEKYLMPESDRVKARITTLPTVEDVMGRLEFSALLNTGRSDLAVVGQGVEPEKEARLGSLMRVVGGRQLERDDVYGIVVGEGVANAMKLKPGDPVTLLTTTAEGAVNSVDFDIVGIFQSFSKDFDARAVRVSLHAAQELMNAQGVNNLVISLKRTKDTPVAAAMIKSKLAGSGLEVQTWQELNDFYRKTVDLYERQFGVLQIILLLMVMLSVANAVNMSVHERMGEFGTLMATGNRRRQVFGLITTECVLLGLMGGVIGTAVGFILGWIVSSIGISMPPPPNAEFGYTARIQLTPLLAAKGFAVGFLATAAAGVLPAFRVARTPVVEALRANI
jgi:putative ABC transport system permease protein